MKYNYIIDTDLGDDIDDTYALLVACLGGLNVVGVTTVFRNSVRRAKMAKNLLEKIGFDTPVYAGKDNPKEQKIENLLPPEILEKEYKNGEYILPQWTNDLDYQKYNGENAVDFLINQAREKENLRIIAIAPLTNIAAAINKAPDIVEKIESIIFIGGCYLNDEPEWNIACDPEAAQVVFSSGIKIYALGLEIVKKCPLTEEMKQICKKTDVGLTLLTHLRQWYDHYGDRPPILYDTLAVVGEIDDSIIEYEKKYIKVGNSQIENERYKTLVANEIIEEFYPVFIGKSFDYEKWESIVKKCLGAIK